MTTPPGRTCAITGVRLVPSPTDVIYRVAKTTYGPASAPARGGADDPSGWNRYDTAGSTLYLAQTPEIALTEVLAVFQRVLGTRGGDPLQKDADALKMTLEEYVNAIAEEWGERYFMQTACVPAIWRDERTLYGLQLPDGWWIDIEHPETLGTLARELSSMLSDAGIEHLTTAVLRGEDRSITTEIAQWCRGLRLDDGSEARGLRFGSKWGGGFSWAYWLRRADDGTGPDPVAPVLTEHLTLGMTALRTVARRLAIHLC